MTCTSATSCSSCNSATYLHNNQCLTNCPADIRVPNSVTRTCDPCNTNCTKCSTLATNCTACVTGTFLYQPNFECVLDCSVYSLVGQTSNNTCVGCQGFCETCLNTPSFCTRCVQSQSFRYLVEATGNCFDTCPPNLYVTNFATSICEPCTSPC